MEELEAEDQMRQHTPRPNAREKKEKKILATYEEPVLPKLCKIIFIFMLILTAAMLLVDINAYLRYDSSLGLLHLLSNISTTGTGSWLIFTLILLALCLPGIQMNKRKFYRQKKESGIEERTEEDRQRNQRALRRLNSEYIFYLKVSLIGMAIWILLYLIFVVLL